MSDEGGMTIREIMLRVLDKTEENARELKSLERHIAERVEQSRERSRSEIRQIEDRVSQLEIDQAIESEKVKSIAGKISIIVSAVTAGAIGLTRFLFEKLQ